jgi:hypothetical protein
MQVEMIKQDTLISMQFNPQFLHRCQAMLSYHISTRTQEEVKQTNDKLAQGNKDFDDWEDHYITLLVLVRDLENNAKEQGLTDLIEVPDSPEQPIL